MNLKNSGIPIDVIAKNTGLTQEEIAAQCRKHGRAFMVVTQMLASMEHRAVPTRAEARWPASM